MKRKKFKINWKKIYTIIINFRKSNLFINLQEVHGLSRHWTSMGMLGFKRRKRNRVQSVIYQYIKFQQSISNIGDFNPFLVWNGVPKRRNYRAIVKGVRYSKRKWNKISWRGSIAMTNLSFNGCRRKKLKRK
jgi:ribosomal protein S11